MTRILHLADLHISEVSTLGGRLVRDDFGRNALLMDVYHAVMRVAEMADPLDGIVIAGDLFDRPRPTANEIRLAGKLLQGLAGMCEEEAVLLVPGNHDMTRSPSDAPAVAGVELAPFISSIENQATVEYAGLSFVCIPYPRRSSYREGMADDVDDPVAWWSKRLAQDVELMAGTAGPGTFLVFHGTVEGATVGVQPRTLEGDVTLPLSACELFDGVMCGHVHKRQDLGDGLVWYSGSPAILDFGEEGEDKGGLLWTIDSEEINVEPITVRGRDWRTLHITDTASLEEVTYHLDEASPEDGTVHRVFGKLSGELLLTVRSAIRAALSRGVIVTDRLELAREDRVQVDPGKKIEDTTLIRQALEAREVDDPGIERALELHREVEADV
jgi:exonuclease SbcD